MGLLDLDSDTLLSGLLSAGAASGAKGNYLSRVAQGLAAGERFKAGRAEQARQRSQDEMQAEYRQLMMRKMQMEAERAQRDDQQGQANNAAVLSSLGGDFDPAQFLQKNPAANVSALEQVIKTRQMMQPKASKFSTTPQYDQQGNAFILAEDGTMKPLAGVKARDPLKEVRLGDKVGFRTDFSSDITGAIPLGQSPDSAASVAATLRGQNMTDSRARERLALDQGAAIADSGGPSQAAYAKLYGKAPPGYRWKPDGNAEAIPGGPADLKNNAGTVAKVTDAQDVLSLLDQAEPLLDKSTGSYAGVAIDEAGRAVGGATPGARAAAQLRALEGALISKMPKMSGPQSDKDVLLYKQMAGQIGDRTIPAEQKRAAMQTIREINSRHAGVAKPAALSPEDAQARDWAMKNQRDPRARQIMQRLGGG